MKKKFQAVIFILFLTMFSLASNCQTIMLTDSTTVIEKAKYNGDLVKTLDERLRYPIEALQKGIAGDVVFSVVITAGGKMNNNDLVTSPDKLLSVSSLIALTGVKGDWTPCKVNSSPVDRKYLIVFRYRIYNNGPPPDYKVQVKRNLEKKKYDQVLKIYDREIKDKPYEYQLFESRSQVKGMMGDTDGAKSDLLKSQKLKSEVMEVVYITGGMVMRREVIGSERSVQRRY